MSSGTSKTRAKYLAAMEFVPTRWGRAVASLQRADVIQRLIVLVLFLMVTAVILRVWDPPFPYHTGSLVDRDIVARVNFKVYNHEETVRVRELEKSKVLYIFDKDPGVMQENMDLLRNELNKVVSANVDEFDKLPQEIQQQFAPLESALPAAANAKTDSGKFWNVLRPGRSRHAPPEKEKEKEKEKTPAAALPSHAPASLLPTPAAAGSGAGNSPGAPGRDAGKADATGTPRTVMPVTETGGVHERPDVAGTPSSSVSSVEEKTEAENAAPKNEAEERAAPEENTQPGEHAAAEKTHVPAPENIPAAVHVPAENAVPTEHEAVPPVEENKTAAEKTETDTAAVNLVEAILSPTPKKEAVPEAETVSTEGNHAPEKAVDENTSAEDKKSPQDKTPEHAGAPDSAPSVESVRTEMTIPEPVAQAAEKTAKTPEEAVSGKPAEEILVEAAEHVPPKDVPTEIAPPENPVDAFCVKLAAILAPFMDRGMLHTAAANEDRDPLVRGIPTHIDIVEYVPETRVAESTPENGTPVPAPPRTVQEKYLPAEGELLTTDGRPQESAVILTTKWRKQVDMQDLVIETNTRLLHALQEELGKDVGQGIFNFICRNWKANLKMNIPATKRAIQDAGERVLPIDTHYERSQRIIAVGTEEDRPAVTSVNLTVADLALLRAENTAWLEYRTSAQRFYRSLSALFVLLAMITPMVCFITLSEPRVVAVWHRLYSLMGMTLVALIAALALSTDTWRFTLLPIVLYSQLITIQYNRKIGLVAGLMLAILVGFGLAVSMTELLMYFGVLLVAVLPVDRIRGRLQFIKIGFGAGCTAFLLSYSNDMLSGQPVDNFYMAGASYATVNFLQLLLGGFLIQGILPFLERWLGILSDARMMELCDQSNPLLSELIDRAPSTYSHSMAVGAIGERAAEAIHCDGLLVRAASYYHDIGKIYKPDYYAENQSLTGVNHHLELEPTMSALIIIAHIKNGVDIARQYKLPEQIVDIIEQHHGTTLVKYFYTEAMKKTGNLPDHSPVDESTFSYPGPKPQTKEAVIVMLADCCESACRTIVDPTSKRIEGLVSKIVQERLEEGQFDDSGLTLRELRTVEDSIVKSLISNYHGRIKYPDMKKEEKK